jgi:hypothetical protein
MALITKRDGSGRLVSFTRLGKVLPPLFFSVGIPGIFGDVSTWGEWFAWLPDGSWAAGVVLASGGLTVLANWDYLATGWGAGLVDIATHFNFEDMPSLLVTSRVDTGSMSVLMTDWLGREEYSQQHEPLCYFKWKDGSTERRMRKRQQEILVVGKLLGRGLLHRNCDGVGSLEGVPVDDHEPGDDLRHHILRLRFVAEGHDDQEVWVQISSNWFPEGGIMQAGMSVLKKDPRL